MNVRLLSLLLLAGLGLSDISCTAAESGKAAQKPKVEVIFEKPDNFADIKDAFSPTEKGKQNNLEELQEYVVDQAARYLAPGQTLQITFTEIDLAGDFEPRRGMEDVRLIKDIYPPRFDFHYQLLDASGAVLKEGKEQLREPFYTSRIVINRRDPLNVEKGMLNDWMRGTLKAPKR